MPITAKMIEMSYEECKNAYNARRNTISDASIERFVDAGWNRTSATMTFPLFKKLMNGERYGRSMSLLQVDIYLNNIHRDYGNKGLSIALKSVKAKIDYDNTPYIGLQNIYNRYLRIL